VRWTSELKVGLATSAALLVLMVALLFVADVRWPGSGHVVTATFGYLGDLRENAPVKYAGGIEIGKAIHIRPLGEKAAVDLLITQKGFHLRKDSYVVIYSAGMLGEKYVNVAADLGQGDELKDGEVIEGQDPANLDETFIQFGRLMDTFDSVLGDKRARESIYKSFNNVAAATNDMAALTRDARAKVNRILDDLAKSGQSVNSVTRSVDSLAKNVDEMTKTLDKKDLNEAIKNLNGTLKSLDELAKNVNAGKGAAGVLLKDEQVATDLKDMITDLRRHPWKLLWKK